MADVLVGSRRKRGAVEAQPPAPAPTDSVIVDVWSRTTPKYRIRAIVLLVVNMLLFCGLCVFTHWLHVGKPFEFAWSSYTEPARFWGEQTRTLNDFILYPISVEQVPMHGVVLGLLLASIVAVPIVTSILYRFRYAMPFVAAVAVFAHMPWMAVTLVASCILASVRPFRMSFRFGAALLGMLPVLAYLLLATRGASDPSAAYAAPAQKSLLMAPWALAILAACAMMGTILLIAWLVNYRPGAITPVVTVMFAMPVLLFHAFVGTDELAYRVLETQYGPGAARFEAVRDPRETWETINTLIRRWTDEEDAITPYRPEFQAIWSGQVDPLKERIVQAFMVDFLTDRAAAYAATKRFLASHSHSRYAPNVLYVQGLTMDTRLDERRLRESPPRRELYGDFPHAQSEAAWSALVNGHPQSPLAIAAAYRLAQLRLRQGEIETALTLLAAAARDAADNHQPQSQPAGRAWLERPPPERSLKFEARPYLFQAQRLAELIRANRDDRRYGTRPLQELACLDPRRASYTQELLRLAEQFREGLLEDNLLVYWAASLPDIGQREERLAACIRRYPEGDALPEALFRLADIEIQGFGGKDEARRAAGVAHMRDVVARFGSSCWGQAAAERLNMVQPAAASVEGGGPQ